MRLALTLTVLLLAACSESQRITPTLVVAVNVPEGVKVGCVLVEVGAATVKIATKQQAQESRRLLLGVTRSDRPRNVELRATGYLDAECRDITAPRVLAKRQPVDLDMHENPVELTLKAPEQNCSNGIDDDDDSEVGSPKQIDCTDSDCEGKPCGDTSCSTGRTCSGGVCGGGTPVTCVRDAGCLTAIGACVNGMGCMFNDAPSSCSDNDACTEQDTCRPDGVCVGTPKRCAAGACQAVVACEQGQCRTTPLDAGSPCDGGVCTADGRCMPSFDFAPSNIDLAQLPLPSVVIDLSCVDGGINTSTNVVTGCTARGTSMMPTLTSLAQRDGGDVSVLLATAVSIRGDVTVTGARPLVIVAYGNVELLTDMTLRNQDTGCPAGGEGSTTRGNLTDVAGGGGGAFGTSGGNGAAGPANAGQANGNQALTPLRGGCPGARGQGAQGGGGASGGALQVSAARTVTVAGNISAPGRGGGGGGVLVGGGGAGSGGGILIEARQFIANTGGLTCNGGGGGQGGGFATDDGMDGSTNSTAASGGNNMLGASGGAGAAATTPAQNGSFTFGRSGGGGGGGVGRIRIRTLDGCDLGPRNTVTISPPAFFDQPTRCTQL